MALGTSYNEQGNFPGSAWRFYLATIAFTWVLWIPLVFYTNSVGDVTQMDLPLGTAVTLLLILQFGAYGPSIMAIILSLKRFGGGGAIALLRTLLIGRVGIRWYGFVLLVPAVLQSIAIGVYLSLGQEIGSFDPSRWPLMLTGFLTLLLFGPLAEELGWRGYALPRLLKTRTPGQASLIMGVVATLWHVPLFYSTFPPFSGVAVFEPLFLAYVGYSVSRCVLYTWIYTNTQGSVLMCVLFHAAGNAAFPLVFLATLQNCSDP